VQELVLETATSCLYAAFTMENDSAVMCKVFKDASRAFETALLERVQLLKTVSSAQLMPVLDVTRWNGALMVVRPRFRALTIHQMVEHARKARRAISHGVAVRLVMDVLSGLEAAHTAGARQSAGPLVTHGEVGPDHVMVNGTGQVLLLGVETPRGNDPAVPLPAKLDLAGACALLYDLLAPKKHVENAVPAPPLPRAFSSLLPAALGLGAVRYHTAVDLRSAFAQTAQRSQLAVVTQEEVATLMRRLLDDSSPSHMPALRRQADPLAKKPPPAAQAPLVGIGPTVAKPEAPASAGGMAGPPERTQPDGVVMPPPAESLFSTPRPISGLLGKPAAQRPRRLGEVLIAKGFISPEQLATGLARQKTRRVRLGQILLEDGSIDDGQLADALSETSHLARVADAELASAEPGDFLLASVPGSLAIGKGAVPLSLDGDAGILVVAVSDPFDAATLKEMQLLVGARRSLARVGRKGAIDAMLARCYPKELARVSAERTEPEIRMEDVTHGPAVQRVASDAQRPVLQERAADAMEPKTAEATLKGFSSTVLNRGPTATISDIAPPAERRDEPTGVSGTLTQMGLAEIVQTLDLGRKTATVTLFLPEEEEGVMVFVDGEVVHAACGNKSGAEAFYELAHRRVGRFKIHYGKSLEIRRTVHVSTTFLLLEAMRRMDERA
jgi:hypothetical protein